MEHEVWDVLQRHLNSIFDGDAMAYEATTGEDLSLFEWWVAPHRQDGLDFHRFMIEHRWAGAGDYRFDLLEPRLQLYGDTAIASYTFMLSRAKPEGGGASHAQRKPGVGQTRRAVAGRARAQVAGVVGAVEAK